jgi:CrcB protein
MPHTRTHRASDHTSASPTAEAVAQPFATARTSRAPFPWTIVAAVSAGGMLGALARYGISTAFPHAVGGFPWATFAINISGCLLIGMLMVAVTDLWPSRKLLRPFLGTGVLGGYTTFSTYIVDAQHLLDRGAAATALAYLASTVVCALAAVWAGSTILRTVIGLSRRLKEVQA